jgi:hypothetical protein
MTALTALCLTLVGTPLLAAAPPDAWDEISFGRTDGRIIDNGHFRRHDASAQCAERFASIDGAWDSFFASPEYKDFRQSDAMYEVEQVTLRVFRAGCGEGATDDRADPHMCAALQEELDEKMQALRASEASQRLGARAKALQIAALVQEAVAKGCYETPPGSH